MSLTIVAVIVLALVMGVGVVALVLLWALTEELPRAERVPFYERSEPGEWAVRLQRVGRRHMRPMRVVNEVLGGDIGAAKHLVEHAPSTVIAGVSEALARDIVAALHEAGAEAEALPDLR